MKTCIRDGCGKPFDPSVPETRDTATLRAFWQRYCPKHRVPAEPPVIVTEQPEPKFVQMVGRGTRVIKNTESPWIVPDEETIRQMARSQFHPEFEVDEGATVSLSEDTNKGPQGAYVQAWVYVPFERNPDYEGEEP